MFSRQKVRLEEAANNAGVIARCIQAINNGCVGRPCSDITYNNLLCCLQAISLRFRVRAEGMATTNLLMEEKRQSFANHTNDIDK